MRLKLIEFCAVQSGTVVWPYSLGLGLWCLSVIMDIFHTRYIMKSNIYDCVYLVCSQNVELY
jgi:hypothetical protein